MLLLIRFLKAIFCFLSRFNTSHVTINLLRYLYKTVLIRCFNTSHVTINLAGACVGILGRFCFNTSHVTINRGSGAYSGSLEFVSIHLMLLLI